MGDYAEIISLTKREIIYKKKKRKVNGAIKIGALFLALFGLAGVGKLIYNEVGLRDRIFASINPIYSPYVETSNMVFASVVSSLESKTLEFIPPVVFESYDVFENEIVFNMLDNGVVRAVEDGVIAEVGKTNDGLKFVKIIHCDGYSSIYENIDVSGINVGEKVSKGDTIATTSSNNFKLALFKDNLPLIIDSIENNIIVCKK